ncbi:hypothetical protein [Streptomyces sp. NPDC093089]|uniref:vWA domain-containing protein n=1 Tax=Streptomyces sp. NPDC093089 TaxID=3366024 RepID=UPI00380EFB8B
MDPGKSPRPARGSLCDRTASCPPSLAGTRGLPECPIGTLAAAKQAVTRIIDTAPERAPPGLRVYGATYPGQDKGKGCADTQQVLPVTPMDAAARADAKKRVAGFKAVGFTPIGVSLREAAEDLGGSGKRRIVLVSDGDDTCAPPPPCEVARELKAPGIDLAVDVVVVGFRTPSSARTQLKCIADATDGSDADADADADDADSLTDHLATLFRKGWRTYQATGSRWRAPSPAARTPRWSRPASTWTSSPGDATSTTRSRSVRTSCSR